MTNINYRLCECWQPGGEQEQKQRFVKKISQYLLLQAGRQPIYSAEQQAGEEG